METMNSLRPETIWIDKARQFLDVVDGRNNGEGRYLRENLLYPRILEHVGNLSGRSFLDAGCGDGIIGRLAIKGGATAVVNCDVVEQFLKETRLRSNGEGHVVLADLTNGLPFAQEVFDVVCYNLVLMWLPEIINTARETERIMKPDGKLVISLLHPWTALSRVDASDPDKPKLSLEHGLQPETFMRTVNKTAGPYPFYQRTIAEYVSTFTREGFYLEPNSGIDEVFAPKDSSVSLSRKLFPEFLILTFLKH